MMITSGLKAFVRKFGAPFATAMLAVLLSAQSAYSQAGTGTVTGRVQNAATGNYLNNARVSVAGTQLVVFTNQFGEYQLTDVPAGETTLRVFFTGLDEREVSVSVPAGGIVAQDIRLTSSTRYGEGVRTDTDEVIELDEFVIAATRDTDAGAIAQNEQRFSTSIKNVVASDAMGNVAEGNIGEFVKFLPGISVDYVAADVRTISIRGFADNYTAVNVDGAPMASSASSADNRAFELEQVSINSVSRVEVVKALTPDMAAAGLGGTINLVSKSAFEKDRASFAFKAWLSVNDENWTFLKKTPGPGNKGSYKALPNFEFEYVNPVSKTLGFVVNGMMSNQFNEQHRFQPTWRVSGALATSEAPYMRQVSMQDGPKNTFRDSLSFRVDWKPTENQVLSATYQVNYYKGFFGNRNINWDVGSTNVASVVTTGTALTFGPTFTHGATGRAAVNLGSSFREKLGQTNASGLKWRFDGSDWDMDASLSFSKSKNWYRDTSRGHFDQSQIDMQNEWYINYDDITDGQPASMAVFDNANQRLDEFNLNNYRLRGPGTTTNWGSNWTANSREYDSFDRYTAGTLNIKRSFDLSFPLAIKIGTSYTKQERDILRRENHYGYVGVDGLANTADDNAGPFVDPRYFGVNPSWGITPPQWPSMYALYEDFVANPGRWRQETVQDYKRATGASSLVIEKITAYYLMAEARFMDGRLSIVGGTRREQTKDDMTGQLVDSDAAFQRNADGSFIDDNTATTALEKRRRPEAGSVGSLEEAYLTNVHRGAVGQKDYAGWYPSIHATYNLTEDLNLRLSYSKTLGRPNFSDIIPSTTVDPYDTPPISATDPGGTITARNPGLKPWQAHNFDLYLEYYGKQGTSIAAGVFYKDITDFFANRPATQATLDEVRALGLTDDYEGWLLTWRYNIGDAKIKGAEFQLSQPLTPLGEWGKSFRVDVNGTKMWLSGPNQGDFQRFIPETGNLAITYSKRPFTIKLKWNYRGRQRVGTNAGFSPVVGGVIQQAYTYFDARVNIDLDMEYQLSKKFSLYAAARNIKDQVQDQQVYNDLMPEYSWLNRSERYGVQWSLGVKGRF